MIETHATVLIVDDVAAALDYYRDKLGFEGHAWEVNPTHYGYASRGGCHVHVCHADGARPKPNHLAFPPDMFDLYVYVDDVDALHEELAGRGAVSPANWARSPGPKVGVCDNDRRIPRPDSAKMPSVPSPTQGGLLCQERLHTRLCTSSRR